jgi:predicted transporter
MICGTCHGTMKVAHATKDALGWLIIVLPCPDCIGGVINCCVGASSSADRR